MAEDGSFRVSTATVSVSEQVARWMRERLAELLELGVADVDVEIPIERYGIDSRTLASLAGELEDWLDCQLPATLLWDYSTIREVSAAIGAIVEGRSR